MTFAILKLSYNTPGETPVIGGVCGTGFFISDSTALTAFHVLSEQNWGPNPGNAYCQYWAILRSGQIIPIKKEFLKGYSQIDTTLITFGSKHEIPHVVLLADKNASPMDMVCGEGHVGGAMPQLQTSWVGSELLIATANLSNVISDGVGHIKRELKAEVNAADLKLKGTNVYELSFQTRCGMSGGPLFDKTNGKLVGILSFGLPENAEIKLQSFAVSLSELRKYLLI